MVSSSLASLPSFTIRPWDPLLKSGSRRLYEMLRDINGKPMVILRVGWRSLLFVSDAEIARHVLQENYKNYRKSDAYEELRLFLGNGLFTAEGDLWRKQRRMMQPTFHLKRLAGLVDTMVAETETMLERWESYAQSGESFDLHREMMRLTLTIVGRTLLGVDLANSADAVGPALRDVLEVTDRRLLLPMRIPPHWPTPDNRRFARGLAVLDERVTAILRERRALAPEERPNDMLSMLLDATDPEGSAEPMSDQQLRDEVMTLVLAGHETTANALSWTFYLLSQHPTIARRLRGEILAGIGQRKATFSDVSSLGYAAMVVQEAMRLYPPVWATERQALGPDVLGGIPIEAGQTVGVNTFALHHNPAYWPNPEGFDPERFAPGNDEGRPRFAYLPFGGGPRVCIGNQFALMEAQIVLACVLRRFRVDLVPGTHVEPELVLVLRPEGSVPITVTHVARRDSLPPSA